MEVLVQMKFSKRLSHFVLLQISAEKLEFRMLFGKQTFAGFGAQISKHSMEVREEREDEKKEKAVCVKKIHSDSASFFVSAFCCKRPQMFGLCGAVVVSFCQQGRRTHCLSVSPPCLKVLKLVGRFNRPMLCIYTPP